MKICIIVVLSIFVCSCAGTNLYKKINYGRYNANSKFYTGDIFIKSDGTFEYTMKVPYNSNICKGNWKIISNKMLLINGVDVTPFKDADSLFLKRIDCENDTIKYISKNRMNFKNLTFKKVSE